MNDHDHRELLLFGPAFLYTAAHGYLVEYWVGLYDAYEVWASLPGPLAVVVLVVAALSGGIEVAGIGLVFARILPTYRPVGNPGIPTYLTASAVASTAAVFCFMAIAVWQPWLRTLPLVVRIPIGLSVVWSGPVLVGAYENYRGRVEIPAPGSEVLAEKLGGSDEPRNGNGGNPGSRPGSRLPTPGEVATAAVGLVTLASVRMSSTGDPPETGPTAVRGTVEPAEEYESLYSPASGRECVVTRWRIDLPGKDAPAATGVDAVPFYVVDGDRRTLVDPAPWDPEATLTPDRRGVDPDEYRTALLALQRTDSRIVDTSEQTEPKPVPESAFLPADRLASRGGTHGGATNPVVAVDADLVREASRGYREWIAGHTDGHEGPAEVTASTVSVGDEVFVLGRRVDVDDRDVVNVRWLRHPFWLVPGGRLQTLRRPPVLVVIGGLVVGVALAVAVTLALA